MSGTPKIIRKPVPHTRRRWLIALGMFTVLCATVFWAGCQMMCMPGQTHRGPLPPVTTPQQELASELRRHVTALAVDIGGRSMRNRPALQRAADYIEKEFGSAGYTVVRESYRVDLQTSDNLVAELTGTERKSEIIVVGAHYDSAGVDIPAANDNASGVAGLLAVAKSLKDSKPGRTIRFVAFTNEEPPLYHTRLMGSRVYAAGCRARGDNVVAMLALETIGYYTDAPNTQNYPAIFSWFYPSTGNFVAFVGNWDSRSLVYDATGMFRKVAKFPSEGAAVPDAITGVGWSDHWSFWQEGYPAIMVTDTAIFRYPYYHTPKDTPDKLDFEKTARVVEGVTAVVREFATRP